MRSPFVESLVSSLYPSRQLANLKYITEVVMRIRDHPATVRDFQRLGISKAESSWLAAASMAQWN